MQLLFESSTELGGADGLGLLPGTVDYLPAPAGLKLPHIGWNLVRFTNDSPLSEELPRACAFYHVHSLAPLPASEDDVLARGDYGAPFVTAVGRERLFGVQFHPEKSSVHGLRLLANFIAICARAAAAPEATRA
jgi:glutamine amidotransferase